MSFFKDFKADFTQAMNELMPDGNEMYDEDEIIDDTIEDEVEEAPKKVKKVKEKTTKEKSTKEKPVKEKRLSRSKKVKAEVSEEEPTVNNGDDVATSQSVLKDDIQINNTLDNRTSGDAMNNALDVSDEEITIPDDDINITEGEKNITNEELNITDEEMDIAPEDMLDQIDDLLDNELYSDENDPQLLLDDDMEVNTMDMSVEELLSQLAMKQNANEINTEEVVDKEVDLTKQVTDVEEELSVDSLLDQLEASASKQDDLVSDL